MINGILATLRSGWNTAIGWLGITPQARQRIDAETCPPQPNVLKAMPIEIEKPAAMRAPRQRKKPAEGVPSSWIHVDQLLDLLPRCRAMMTRLKRIDRDGYQFWRQMGVRLVDENVNGGPDNCILPEKHNTKGMVFIYDKRAKENDAFPGFFVYFNQVKKNPWNCAVPKDSVKIFHVTVVWTDDPTTPFEWGYDYYVSVDAQGVVTPCSQRQVERQKVGFWRTEWGLGAALLWHYRIYCRERAKRNEKALSVNEFAATTFLWGLCAWTNTSEGFQIRAEKHGVSATFNVSPKIAPRFFADRETGLTTDGKRYRIFHAVREHSRVRDGRVSIVPAHYRGERVFTWNGEKITITPPERSFGKAFNLEGVILHEDEKTPRDMVEMHTVAPKIRNAVEAEWRKKVASQPTIH